MMIGIKNPKETVWTALIGTTLLISAFQFTRCVSEDADSSEKEGSVEVRGELVNGSSEGLTWAVCGTQKPSLMDIVLSRAHSKLVDETNTHESEKSDRVCSVRPKCDEVNGCNAPLFCFDYSKLDTALPPSPPQTQLVTPQELEKIVEDTAVQNVCAIVLFYAPWCTFSVQFARKFNALGRSFVNLPILAVNLAESEPYKYILAYLPVAVFYYRGKTLFRFSLDSPFEDLRATVANITGFEPLLVDLADPQNEGPVLTERERSDRAFLAISVWWVAFVGLVYAMQSQQLRQWYLNCLRTTTRLTRRE